MTTQILEHRLLDEHDYAIIDRLNAPALPPGLPLIELVPQGLETQAHLLPWLLPLRALDTRQRAAVFDGIVGASNQGRALLAAYLIRSTTDLDLTKLRMKKRLLLNQHREGRFLLRYYDPRVWAQMQWIYNAQVLGQWMHDVEYVSFWLLDQWHRTERPDYDRTDISIAHRQLDTPSFGRIARVGAINEVLSRLPACATLAERQAQSQRIDALLQRAENDYAFDNEKDRIAFAWHGMRVGAGFDRHPRIARLIETLAQEEASFRDAIALITPAEWEQIHRDLNGKHSPILMS